MTIVPELQMPYIGLRPFDELDEPLFFGREAQVSQMLRQLEDHSFLAVVGASGSGKSSLVRAGLLPAIRQGFLLGATDWSISVIRPGHEPYQRLAEALIGTSSSVNADAQHRDAIVGRLRSSDLGIRAALNELSAERSDHALIVVDQFEELFAFRRTNNRQDEFAARDEASAFVRALLRGSSDPHGPVRVIVTMRSDFIGDAEAFLGLPEAVSRNQFLVPRLNRHQMEEAIVGPSLVGNAGYRPFSLDANLVNRIINDAGDRPDQLPLMQHALMCTWKLAVTRVGDRPVLLQSDYDDAGGIEKALSRHADAAWHQLKSARLEQIAKRLFLLLCDVSPDGQITRRRPRIDEVQTVAGATLEEIAAILRVFQEDDRNFLLPPSGSHLAASTTLDISHESLIRQWKRFNEWVSDETASAATFQRLRESSIRWPQQEPLLRDPALTLAANWLEEQCPSSAWAGRYGGGLDRVKDYVQHSQDAQRKEAAAAELAREKELADSRRREAEEAANAQTFRRWTIALAVLCVVALGSLWYSVRTRGQNRSLIKTNEVLAAEKRALDEVKARLSGEIGKLGDVRRAAEVEFDSLKAQVTALGATKSSLESRQRQLDLHNSALSKAVEAHGTVAAYGTVQKRDDGTVEVAFQQSIPDEVLRVLPSVGRISTVHLRRSTVTDASLKPLTNITGLVELDLSNTNIGDAGVETIAELTGVRRLRLNDTKVTDASVPLLGTLTGLESLELSRTRISSQEIARLRGMLRGTKVEYEPDPLLEALATSGGNWDVALKAPGVNGTREGGSIRFTNSGISDAVLKFLDEFQEVQLLGCRNITSEGLRYLSRHKGISKVALRKISQVNDEGIDALLQLPNLRELELDSIGITDRSLFNMARVKGLTTLRLVRSSVDLTEAGLGALVSLPALTHLAMEHDLNLTTGIVIVVSKLPALEILSLKGIRFAGVDVSALASVSRLQRLDLSLSQIPPETIKVLTNVKSLRALDVRGTYLRQQDLAVLRASNPNLVIASGAGETLSESYANGLRALLTEGRTLKYGDRVAGTLAGAPLIGGRRSIAWQLAECPADGQVQVDLISTAFDAFLVIEGDTSDPLRTDDDGGSAQNSRLVLPCRESGYKLIASALEGTGDFELSAGPPRALNSRVGRVGEERLRGLRVEPQRLAIGTPITARLQSTAQQQGQDPAMAWDLGECTPGTRIQLDVKSSDFDALLVVIDKESGTIQENDDGGDGLNAQLSVQCPSSGLKVIASTVEGDGRFEVSATLSTTSPTERSFREMTSEPGALEFGRPFIAKLTSEDQKIDGQPVKAWNLGGCAPGRRVQFDLTSKEFDPQLIVIDASGTLLENDDTGSGLNSRVLMPCHSLGFKVIVTSMDGIGTFELRASVRDR